MRGTCCPLIAEELIVFPTYLVDPCSFSPPRAVGRGAGGFQKHCIFFVEDARCPVFVTRGPCVVHAEIGGLEGCNIS